MAAAAVVFSASSPDPAQALAAGPAWQAPVSGGPVLPYRAGRHPFERGAHRGVDLAARPGDPVVAACAGEVAFAGAVAGSRVVTISCGRWRVTHLPLRDVRVTAGQVVRAGQPLASFAADGAHAGLHVGVRRAGDRFGYVDPWPLLSRAGRAHPPMAVPGPRRGGPRGDRRPSRRPVGDRRSSRRSLRHPRPSARPLRHEPSAGLLAPPVAWIGLAIVLAGAAQARRRRRAPAIRLRAEEPATSAR